MSAKQEKIEKERDACVLCIPIFRRSMKLNYRLFALSLSFRYEASERKRFRCTRLQRSIIWAKSSATRGKLTCCEALWSETVPLQTSRRCRLMVL